MLEWIKSKLGIDDTIGDPPYDYYFLLYLNEKEYPKYLKKIFKDRTGKELKNLRNPKTFSEKIQWLKLYDSTPLKSQLTDKILVRDWVKEKIGEKYLKPILWIGKKFDDVPFETLPDKFVIKTNHGCKWHFKIKDKQKFLSVKGLYDLIKERMDGWMKQTFFPYAGFELQYKDIHPQLFIEPLLVTGEQECPVEYEIYCFNGKPKIYQKIVYSKPREVSVYDEHLKQLDIKFMPDYVTKHQPVDDLLVLAVELSRVLAENFKLVRVDWLVHNDKIYFNEMTFTPFSGFYRFEKEQWDKKIGEMLDLK